MQILKKYIVKKSEYVAAVNPPNGLVLKSPGCFVNPWHFGADPDPGIRTTYRSESGFGFSSFHHWHWLPRCQ
jgi:hypothetical protein